MLWQGELFLVLKIDGGRLGGSREGEVSISPVGGFKAPMTLQFERISEWRRRRELKGETHTRRQIEKTQEVAEGWVTWVPNKTKQNKTKNPPNTTGNNTLFNDKPHCSVSLCLLRHALFYFCCFHLVVAFFSSCFFTPPRKTAFAFCNLFFI